MKKRGLQLLGGALAIAMLSTVLQVPTAYAAETLDETQIIPSRVTRVFGETRYETSLKIAEALRESLGITQFDSIIIANGTGFADALAGSYLANVKNAPILMTNGKNVQQLKSYIDANLSQDGVIYILGGEAAVPKTVDATFPAGQYKVVRLAGADRYETNIEILKEAGVAGRDLLVCTGTGFADSLSGSAVGDPIFLVGTALTKAQKEFLETADLDQIYVIGGNKVVTDSLAKSLEKYDGDGKVVRLAGEDRYETTKAVAEEFFDNPDYAVLAYARNFPDGLCGGPLAYSKNAPLILTQTGKEDKAAEYTNVLGIGKGVVLGGRGLISDEAAKKIFAKTASTEAATTQYTLKVSTTLHTGASNDTPVVTIPYMTKVEYLGKVSATSNWAKVKYDGQVYYLWQEAGEDYLTSKRSSFQYTADNQIQQDLIQKALYIYNNWDTKYAHNQSTGIKDVDGKYGFDCSGFAAYVLDSVMQNYVPTYDVSANLTDLYNTKGIYNDGYIGEFSVTQILSEKLDESQLCSGDILFFDLENEESIDGIEVDHCGIYLGNGEFIHCTTSWGGGVIIMPLDGIYVEGFVAAKRYIPDEINIAGVTKYTNGQKNHIYGTQNSDSTPLITLEAEVPVVLQFTDNRNWSYICYETGKYGFVLSKYLDDELVETSALMYTRSIDLKLYKDHTTSSDCIIVPIGTAVKYNGRYSNSNYYKVTYEDTVYYIYAKDGIDARLTSDYGTLMNGCGDVDIHSNVNLRTSTDSETDENIIRLMNKGEKAVLIAQSDGGSWCYIKLEDGTYGYVSTKYINITKNE